MQDLDLTYDPAWEAYSIISFMETDPDNVKGKNILIGPTGNLYLKSAYVIPQVPQTQINEAARLLQPSPDVEALVRTVDPVGAIAIHVRQRQDTNDINGVSFSQYMNEESRKLTLTYRNQSSWPRFAAVSLFIIPPYTRLDLIPAAIGD